jgi:hypothetical protein
MEQFINDEHLRRVVPSEHDALLISAVYSISKMAATNVLVSMFVLTRVTSIIKIGGNITQGAMATATKMLLSCWSNWSLTKKDILSVPTDDGTAPGSDDDAWINWGILSSAFTNRVLIPTRLIS